MKRFHLFCGPSDWVFGFNSYKKSYRTKEEAIKAGEQKIATFEGETHWFEILTHDDNGLIVIHKSHINTGKPPRMQIMLTESQSILNTLELSTKSSVFKSLDIYVNKGILPGSFLTAVLENDLKEACKRADIDNKRILFEIVSHCYNKLPASCWGSPENVREWVKMHRALKE